jgi:DNA topoisomerase-1
MSAVETGQGCPPQDVATSFTYELSICRASVSRSYLATTPNEERRTYAAPGTPYPATILQPASAMAVSLALASDLSPRRAIRAATEQPVGEEAADLANLRYVSDDEPGLTRVVKGTRVQYRDADGKVVRDKATLARIKALVIPPAWTRVWICGRPDGHIQATGRDARGRKQYRYHPRWQQVRDAAKYGRLLAFGKALPALRRRVMADLQAPPLSRARVLATVVRLLETTLIRIGNEEYARTNQSFGLTTLRDRHVTVSANRVRFRFRAKSGVWQEIALQDGRLARTVKRCQELPGQVLFQYVDEDGARQRVTSEDVNGYLQEAMGESFTAKDFRTWAGTVMAAAALDEFEQVASTAGRKKNVTRAIEAVARQLGNTKAVCRRCYVHPAVLETYLDGATLGVLETRAAALMVKPGRHLSREETAVLALLHRRMQRERGRRTRVRTGSPQVSARAS